MRPLVVLRPEPGASETADRARRLGLEVQLFPLFAARALHWDAPPAEAFDALLLTSANAARLAGDRLADYHRLPAYAVGMATARAMEKAGFTAVVAGDDDGTAIARRIVADGHRHALHLSCQTVARIDPGPLQIDRIAVYEMVPTDEDGLAARIAADSVLMVHSPRAGQLLTQRVGEAQRGALHLIAISPAALAASGEGWASANAVDKPDDERMLALARRLCE